MEILSAIEHSALATWVREDSSLWAYPGLLFIHTVGVAIIVGLNIVIDLRLLGFARRLPVAPLDAFFPIIWAGFWMNAISGVILFAADATGKVHSPLFGVKLLLVAAAVWTMGRLRRAVFQRPGQESISLSTRRLAALSLVLWIGVTTAGRLMTYFGSGPGTAPVSNTTGG